MDAASKYSMKSQYSNNEKDSEMDNLMITESSIEKGSKE